MLVIGITGGIGAGKSVVSRIIRCKGYEVYDCDLEAKRIMDLSPDLHVAIAERFGNECIMPDGALDRKQIAKYVFGNDDHRLWLNSMVHAMVREDIKVKILESKYNIFFIESAILKSSRLTEMCNEIWLVTAPEELRLQRAMDRDKADRQQIIERMKSQQHEYDFPSTRNHETCDFPSARIIINDSSHPLLPQITSLLTPPS